MSYSTFLALLQSLGRSIGLSASLILLFGYVLRARWIPRPLKAGLIGSLFGLGAVLAMTDPVTFQNGVILDGRGIMLALAAPFGGYEGAIIAALIAIEYRTILGGAVFAGGVGIVIAAGVGALFKFAVDRLNRPLRESDFLVLGGMICATLLALPLLPADDIHHRILTILPVFFITHALGTIALGTLLLQQKHIVGYEQLLGFQGGTDSLTGLYNRRAFDAALVKSVKSDAGRKSLSLLLIDLDQLRSINDRHGRDAGDEAMRTVSQTIRASIRATDIPARIGSDEFAVILVGSDISTIRAVRKRIRAKLHTASVALSFGPISVSIGASMLEAGMDTAALLRQADKNLETAKSIEQRYGAN